MREALLAMLPKREAPAPHRKVGRLQRLQARLVQQARLAALVCALQLPRGASPSALRAVAHGGRRGRAGRCPRPSLSTQLGPSWCALEGPARP